MVSPERAKHLFYVAQAVVGGGLVFYFVFLRAREPKSNFRVREADRWKSEGARFPSAQPLPSPAKPKKKAPPLQLTGIRIDGAPHEILGVAPNASARDIQKAYRDLIKRFHPDVVGRPGSREWEDAQRIAEALNQAKDEMLRNLGGRKA